MLQSGEREDKSWVDFQVHSGWWKTVYYVGKICNTKGFIRNWEQHFWPSENHTTKEGAFHSVTYTFKARKSPYLKWNARELTRHWYWRSHSPPWIIRPSSTKQWWLPIPQLWEYLRYHHSHQRGTLSQKVSNNWQLLGRRIEKRSTANSASAYPKEIPSWY